MYGTCLLTSVTSLAFDVTSALLCGRRHAMIAQLNVKICSAVSSVLLLASLMVLVFNRFFSRSLDLILGIHRIQHIVARVAEHGRQEPDADGRSELQP